LFFYAAPLTTLLVVHKSFTMSLNCLSIVCFGGGASTTATAGVTGAVFFFASLTTPAVQDVQVPQHAQQHPQNENGMNIAAMHCTMHTVPSLSWPGLLFKSSNPLAMHESYLPQHPPQHMQHGMQQIASSDNSAQALRVLQQVNSSVFILCV
jgi:hypothetical protein